jgi:hypothetical protein
MIAYDDMQAIYKERRRPVSCQLGIKANGRTRVPKVNYRNNVQILGFARQIAEEVVGEPGVADADEAIRLVEVSTDETAQRGI